MYDQQAGKMSGTILIVGEEHSNSQLLSNILIDRGYELESATNSQEAISFIDKETPDLILIDTTTPDTEDYKICRDIKAHECNGDIPVIILATFKNIDDKIRSYDAGAVDIITKPFLEEEILARVDTHITLSHLHRNISQQVEKRMAELHESEERYHLLVEAAPVSIMAMRNGCILFANPASARMLGFSNPDKMVGISAIDIVAPESLQLVTERIERLESGKDNPLVELALIRQDGMRITVESTSVSIPIGGIPTAVIIAQDISDRKEREEMLQMMQFAVDNALDRIAWIAPDGRFLYANEAACTEMAYTLDEVLSMRVSDIDPDFPMERWAEHYQAVKQKGSMWLETQQIAGDGKIHDVEVSTNVLKFGEREFMCSFGRDITERKRYVDEIVKYKHIIESTNNPIGLVDKNIIYQYVNEPYCQALKKPANEIIGHSVPELFGQDFFETVMESHYKKCFAGENVKYQEWFDFPGWGRRYMDARYYPFHEADGQVTGVVTNIHDITEIKQLEMELIENHARFFAFMENIPGGIYIKDENDVHLYCNQFAAGIVKMKPEDVIGSSTRDIHPPELADKLVELDKQVIDGDVPRISEEWDRTDKEDIHWFRDIKFPINLESGKRLLGGIALDITEIKESEQKLKNAYSEIKLLKEELEQENIYLKEEIQLQHNHNEIIGESKEIEHALHQAEQVADNDTTVLISGETGTGKELLAQAIHRMSPRKDRAMVMVNCAAIPPTLIESELFGAEKGAYTGAIGKRIGRFEIANGSTLFLDEISEFPYELQAKLLRVLQDGRFERLGSSNTIHVDVRIVAATNKDLRASVKEGRFRKDLFYRLNVFPINMPSLKDRRDDIPQLVWFFVKDFSRQMGKTVDRIPKKTMDLLQSYYWPGNVRELKNIIERAMILSTDKILRIDRLETDEADSQDDLTLEAFEKSHIMKVLGMTGWKVKGEMGAAKILGLKPPTLYSRMKKLGIKRNS